MTPQQELAKLQAELEALKARAKEMGMQVPSTRHLIVPRSTYHGLQIPEGCTGAQLTRFYNAHKPK